MAQRYAGGRKGLETEEKRRTRGFEERELTPPPSMIDPSIDALFRSSFLSLSSPSKRRRRLGRGLGRPPPDQRSPEAQRAPPEEGDHPRLDPGAEAGKRGEVFFFVLRFFFFLFLLGRPSSLGAPSSFQPQPQPRPSRPLSLLLKLSSAPPPPPSPSRAAATAPPRTSPSPSRPASSSASSASAASALFGSTRRRKRRVEPSAPCLSAETTSRSRSHRQGSPR